MTEQNPNSKQFLIRLGAVVGAVVLIMFLAKTWFFGQGKRSTTPQYSTAVQETTPLAESSQSPGETPVISWRDAAKYYGKYATVEGTIVATHNSGKACFLNFHPDYKRYFTAVIFASAFSRFPPSPENHYQGKKVRVTGYIKEYNGKPEIILNDPSQIEIMK